MNPLFKKMQFKDQPLCCILNAPESFFPAMEEMATLTEIHTAHKQEELYPFLLAFVKSIAELADLAEQINGSLTSQDLFWVAYPKKSSRIYNSDITRDQGWQPIGDLGYEPVRMVAIDADWSALRFRKAELITTMKRRNSAALSKKGKERTKNNPTS